MEPDQDALAAHWFGRDTVNLKRIIRQLRREVTANPKRATVLGLLAVVALWLWAPLAIGWLAEDDSDDMTVPINSAAGPSATLPPTEAAPTEAARSNAASDLAKSPPPPWQRLVEWMDNDPRTLTATHPSQRRDPFVTPVTATVEANLDQQLADGPGDVTPESLGMVLSSTIIGPRRRVARINGKSYRQGRTIELTKDGRQFAFLLAEVRPRRVVLRREGEQFELRTPAPGGTNGIELTRSTN